MTSDNKPVENKDLVQSILDKMNERTAAKAKTMFEWVKGHYLDHGNAEADRLAVSGAQRGVEGKKVALGATRDLPDEFFEDDVI